MKTTQLLSIVIGSILLSSCFDDGKTTFQTPNIPTTDGYSLVWSDEFSIPYSTLGAGSTKLATVPITAYQ